MLTRCTVLKRGLATAGSAIVALAIVALLVPSSARAQSVSLRMQGFLPSALSTQKAFEEFARVVNEKSGGKLVVHVLPVGGAVGVTETISAIQAGVLDGHHTCAVFHAAKEPGFGVLDTGPTFDTVEQRDRWFTEGDGVTLLRELYAQFGIHYVGNVFWQVEHIPSRKPLNGMADLKGLKIRVPPGLISDMLSKAGAAVVNIAGGDVFNALQSGVIDATDWSSPSMNIDSGHHKAAKYSIDASHSLPACEIAVSKAKWDAIPADLKKLFEAEVRAMSAKVKDTILAADKAALEKMKADGVQVITWPKEEVAKLRAVTWEVQDQFAARSPMAKKIVESLRSFQKKTAR